MRKEEFYPAVFQQEETGEYSVFFPDIPGCNSCGKNLPEAYEMAFDALGIMLTYFDEEHMTIPEPSEPSQIQLEDNQFVAIIRFDYIEYKKKVSNKSVKKTLSIPEWLNEAALQANINFSNVLQEALKQKLDIH
ncbi:MAG: type II toxin-antitoxin system HicB family antitoxin [Lachnospiraceae bacterium]